MQPLWTYDTGDTVHRRVPSSGSESLKSSIFGLLESSSGLETRSRPESEEGDLESHSQHAASDQDENSDVFSVARSPQGSEAFDEFGEDEASSYISDEQSYDESGEDEASSYISDEQYGELGPDILDKSARSNPQAPTSEKQTYAGLLGLLKNEFYNSITISDDRSAGSKFEERNLLALRGRRIPKPESSPPSPKGNHALQDYQHQLMLLEQQNKRRLMMARQEQDQIALINSAATDVDALTSAVAGMYPATNTSKDVDDHKIKTDIKQVLDQADPSKVDLQKLQEYIELLQAQARQFESIRSRLAPSRHQIIYRIHRLEPVQQRTRKQKLEDRYMPFFDHPEWVQGQGSASQIKSNLPLTNFELYLEKNKDISFIVYRNFDQESALNAAQQGTDNVTSDKATHRPKHTQETVRPVHKDLIEAIKALLDSRQEYAELASEFSASLELPAPYLFIYHSRNSLKKFQDRLSLHAKVQLSLLLDYVTEQYADEYATADSILSRNKISPKLLHYLFKPGDVLISRVDSQHVGYVSTSWPKINWSRKVSRMRAATSQIGTPMSLYGSQDADVRVANNKRITVYGCDIKVWNWAFDGNFQRQHSTLSLEIPAVEDEENVTDSKGKGKATAQGDKPTKDMGEKNISDLNVFPMQYAPAEVVDKCRRRGKTFWKCRSRSYVSYQATERDSFQNSADERYMIDLKAYISLHPESRFGQTDLKDELGPEALARDEPPDMQFELLLPLKIKGYNLRIKKWFDLVADRISDVKWNKEAFQNLVIDRKARDLIRALVSNQLAAEKGTDLIMGKGNGLILLLHGGPGTGKTLTAESVAEIAEKPLYRVTCGDVGTKAEDVEKYLESVLHLGKIWGCVVLLDEADVFLEQRSLEDMKRNALVSVFLRVLEYYEGILILTSNRVGTFDEAFRSRIQLALHYPVLGPYQRLRIWENFINRLDSFGDDDKVDCADLRDHLEDLKEEKMNGRQIRNAITTARQYAEWKGDTLNYEHLSDVIEVSGRFDKYLDRLNDGFSQDELAHDEGLR